MNTKSLFMLIAFIGAVAFYVGRMTKEADTSVADHAQVNNFHDKKLRKDIDAKLKNLENTMHFHFANLRQSVDEAKNVNTSDAELQATAKPNEKDTENAMKQSQRSYLSQQDEISVAQDWIASSIQSRGRDYAMENSIVSSFISSSLNAESEITSVECAEASGCKVSFDHLSDGGAHRVRGSAHSLFPWAYAGYVDALGDKQTDVILFISAEDYNAIIGP